MGKILQRNPNSLNLIIFHLGNGASVCAIKQGKSYNTSMGMTPLAGLIMGTRAGDIDCGIIEYMHHQTKKSYESLLNDLNFKSGLLGISQQSSDIREIISHYEDSDTCKLAIELFTNRLVTYFSQYLNELENHLDAVVFTAGIGENASLIRSLFCQKVFMRKIIINENLNKESKNASRLISNSDSEIPVYVVATNEEIIIFQSVKELLSNSN
jgi:acetate kinase